ncbi:hypothetical protein C7974DRAFT_312103, partial [Boeremia exigua]|uniref:uncharacterized protein n=1 Tax=Boeremia exigua TaxID=749465 RepID=UPI001E8DC9D5
WLPYTLRRSYLAPLGLSALILAITLAILCVYSLRHDGIGKEDGSVGLFVARRYIPTIIAVLFTLALTMIAEDVKRTEAFARMASPQPVTASHTLFYLPQVWWKSVFQGLSRKRSGGHRRWVLSMSSLAAGISVLVISTLSSSVFVTKEVLLRTESQLQQHTSHQDGSIPLLPRRDTYTRTISGFLYNASTSLWISDSHVILPFLTPGQGTARQPPQDGTWEAETIVLKFGSTCTPMALAEKADLNITFVAEDDSSTGRNATFQKESRGLKLRSEDGCEVQLQTPIAPSSRENGAIIIDQPIGPFFSDSLTLDGGMIWTNLSSSYISWQSLIEEHGRSPPIDSGGKSVQDQWRRTFIYGISQQCLGRDLLFVSPAWFGDLTVRYKPSLADYWKNLTVRAELCTPTYSMATIPVTAVIGNATSRVFFDEAEFLRNQQPLPTGMIDLDRLNELAFGKTWQKYLSVPGGVSGIQGFEGPSVLLAKTYSLVLENLLHNATLPERASRLRSRFFTELISSSVLDADIPVLKDISAKSIRAETRIVVVPGVSITLAILLFLAACYSFAMLWFVSGHRRPLDLDSDPGALAGIVPLTDVSSSLTACLRTWTAYDRTEIQAKVGTQVVAVYDGTLRQQGLDHGHGISSTPSASIAERRFWQPKSQVGKHPKTDWRPSMLHKVWLACLLLSIVAIAIALLILNDFASKDALFQTAFVQQISFNAFHATFSPHAIVATLIAVIVGLCWDSIDKSMRTLQPYLALSKGPLEPSHGLSVSYQSSYWLWAAVRSARVKHWLLCLVTVGSTLSQILVIAMAAIFERHTVIHKLSTDSNSLMTTRLVRARQEPFEFSSGLGSRPFYLNDGLLGTSETDWLYNALDDITLGTTPLSWAKDEWVFTPVNVTNQDDRKMLYIASSTQSEAIDGYVTSALNVSLTTSALRGRLECEAVNMAGLDWLDDVKDVYPNRFNKSVTGHVLPLTLSAGSQFAAPVFSVPRRMACCTNDGSKESPSIIAYWSTINPDDAADIVVPSGWSRTFAIKWIVGLAASTLIPGSDPNHVSATYGNGNESVLYFPEEPQMSTLKCNPVIEQANASITLARDSAQILHYELLEPPYQATGAWDYAYDVMYRTPRSNDSEGNVRLTIPSFGAYFISQLLTAPSIIQPAYSTSTMVYNQTIENLGAERFTLRDTDKGTNMDYMSYANYVLANKDATALLNTTALQKYSEQTFQTFFKHFAASANWTYNSYSLSRAAYEVDGSTEEFNGTITQRIEALSMNKVATWLSLSILFLLTVILVVLIVALQTVYPRTSMRRHVECLADVLAMVAGSDELVRLVNEIGVEGMEKAGIKTRLGWFRDKRGVIRWGVEVVNENVEWVEGPAEAG